MPIPVLPPPVDLSVELKKAVIDGLKKVIETFKAKGVLGAGVTYQDVIHDPEVLFNFIQVFRANRQLVDGIVLGRDKKPVRDEVTPLVCGGVTLQQVQQLLVKTCAKYYFEKARGQEETVVETVTTTRFFFFKKTEQVERKVGPTADDRKSREILRYLAFDWQLPLLEAFKDDLIYQQVFEIGDDMVALNSVEGIRIIGQLDPTLIKKAKNVAGPDFGEVLMEQPQAVAGIAAWSRDLYTFYRGILGARAFEFFAREKHFFNVAASLDKPLARTYGDVLVYIDPENLQEMQRLNIDKSGVLIEALKASLVHMNQEKDQLLVATTLTCKAIAPQIVEWCTKQKASA